MGRAKGWRHAPPWTLLFTSPFQSTHFSAIWEWGNQALTFRLYHENCNYPKVTIHLEVDIGTFQCTVSLFTSTSLSYVMGSQPDYSIEDLRRQGQCLFLCECAMWDVGCGSLIDTADWIRPSFIQQTHTKESLNLFKTVLRESYVSVSTLLTPTRSLLPLPSIYSQFPQACKRHTQPQIHLQSHYDIYGIELQSILTEGLTDQIKKWKKKKRMISILVECAHGDVEVYLFSKSKSPHSISTLAWGTSVVWPSTSRQFQHSHVRLRQFFWVRVF